MHDGDASPDVDAPLLSEGGDNLAELSVSELAMSIKRTLESSFGVVRVRGELGRVTVAKSGHMYFDLKDDKALINAIMWKGAAGKLPFKAEEGLEVVAEGRLSTYPGRSNYQLVVETMRPAGVGALMQLLEERKRKLAAEGLFDPSRKRDLPFLPSVIGVVTSPTGAVIRDIIHRVRDRFPVRVLVWPVLVQGEKAAEQIEAGILGFNALKAGGVIPRPDVIIVARGGGSIEDLWAFNEERVVRAAAASGIPLISAVGHETDTTLIDFASDKRAPTPTGAAEMALPVRSELISLVDDLGGRTRRSLVRGVERRRLQMASVAARLPKPEALLQQPRQKFDVLIERLSGALGRAVSRKRSVYESRAGRLQPTLLKREIANRAQRTAHLGQLLQPAIGRRLTDAARRLEAQGRLLETLSHAGVLKRGFALVVDGSGQIVRSVGRLTPGNRVRLRLGDGEAGATIDPDGRKGAADEGESTAPASRRRPQKRPVDASSEPRSGKKGGSGTGAAAKPRGGQGELF
ncbi:exodeoxyribonuclease VII large subunit [bacterium]|nr:exodeoxyribonuclease VII large subunit [bacterium]